MSYFDEGYDKLLNRSSLGGDGSFASSSVTQATSTIGGTSTETLTNPVTDSVSPQDIESGSYTQHFVLDRDGHIRGGATDYEEGTGFWLGYHNSTDTYRFFIGTAAGNRLTWDGTTLTVVGTITASAGIIGGWNITADTLYSLASGTPTASPH